jgi:hypothetical protein
VGRIGLRYPDPPETAEGRRAVSPMSDGLSAPVRRWFRWTLDTTIRVACVLHPFPQDGAVSVVSEEP